MLWRAADPGGFEIRQWDGEVVLYVLASGETHALTLTHGAAFLTLLEQPGAGHPAGYWLAAMSAGDVPPSHWDIQDAADLEVLTGVLADLHAIGVVERWPT